MIRQNIIKEITAEINNLLNEVYQEALQLLANRWIFMDNKDIFYDGKIKGYFPNCNEYTCTHSGNTFDIPQFEDLSWSLLSETELTVLYNDSKNFPFKNKEKFLVAPNTWSTEIRCLDNQGKTKYKSFDKECTEGYNFPVSRLESRYNLVKEEVVIHWLQNNIIPRDSKLKDTYKTLIDIYKNTDVNYVRNHVDQTIEVSKMHQVFNNSDVTSGTDKLIKFIPQVIFNQVEKCKQDLLDCDKHKIASPSYDTEILTTGHWEVTEQTNNILSIKNNNAKYRNPILDIKEGGVVGIDFGAKSTVVVYQENSQDIVPMYIGTPTDNLSASDFENPTLMKLTDVESFMENYNSKISRPNTKWADITISHGALDQFLENSRRDYYMFLNDLKTSCTYDDESFNPMEIYAYYLGLYINNMRNGIYLQYLISYPVSYSTELRQRLVKSFEMGLKKSLPQEILSNEEVMKKFSVTGNVSEPAAYVISAFKEYGFCPEDGEAVYYGVFDFGGGSADFDFGIYRAANKKQDKRRHHFALEQFGAHSDPKLGGEKLLKIIATTAFKANINYLKKQDITLNGRNVAIIMELLRPLWEDDKDYKSTINKTQIRLFKDNDQLSAKLKLKIDCDMLEEMLKNRIELGVARFFTSLRDTFSDITTEGSATINIFLAGNASKSRIVRHLFEKYMQGQTSYDIFPPLGTQEAKEKMLERGIQVSDDITRPTAKTAVAFGTIIGRKTGNINIINHNEAFDTDTSFNYYVGQCDRHDKFETIITPTSNFQRWIEFIDAEIDAFELYYTTSPLASTNTLEINEVKKINVHLQFAYEDPTVVVFIRPVSTTEIEYMVARKIDVDYEILELPKVIKLN
ncbi:MAG: hypothetical protein ATN35_04825 [Epulopiscium sp. Nele67-Bin004]|nr:MAG: hypothetical protein ATN35_04825 [Epulopiscium sp. Nele67-Bin004]